MGKSADPSLTVFAWGNTARGDDAIGPILAERLRAMNVAGLRVIEDHQLNIEHVYDLKDSGAALFIDASIEIEDGFKLERIGPSDDGNFSTHAISPQALLNVYERTVKAPAPDAWLLHIAGRDFGLGEEMGEIATRAIDGATAFLESLLAGEAHGWHATLEKHTADPPAETA